jgi:predicted ATPase
MKLSKLHVHNYRSLADVAFPLRDLMVVIGPNGAGKTALLEVLQLLHRGSQKGLGDFLASLGGFQSVLSRDEIAVHPLRLKIRVEVDVESERSRAPMVYQLELEGERVGYKVSSEWLEWDGDPHLPQPVRYLNAEDGQYSYFELGNGEKQRSEGILSGLELALAQVPRLHPEPEAFRAMLARTWHYSSLDISPRAAVRLPQSLTPATRPGPNGEDLYSALYNLRASQPDVYERIRVLLQQGFPDFRRLEFPVVGAGQVTLAWYEDRNGRAFYPNELSEGTLRFLWLAAILLAPPAPALILLDEPEVSMHPDLIKLLSALLQDASARSQIVVATHSPDLIRWLQPEEVLIADKEEGVTRFTWADELDLKEWLKEYTLRDLWLMGNLGGRP